MQHAPSGSVAGRARARDRQIRQDRRTTEQIELGTAAWVHWWNTARLHGACDNVPPAEYEAAYWANRQVTAAA